MLIEIYQNIVSGLEVRQNLIALKKELKQANNKIALLYHLAGDYSTLYNLLEHEDAKIRKNTVLIMGELEVPEFMDKIFKAYSKEEKLFIKSDYLVALKHFDYRKYIDELKIRLDFLVEGKFEETSIKHIIEEKMLLIDMVLDIQGSHKHTFKGYNVLSDIVLLTNRDHKEVTLCKIKEGSAKTFNAGVIARTKNLKEILDIRTYSEMLFRLKNVLTIPKDIKLASINILKGGILDFLDERHEGNTPYYFRLEVKSKMPLSEKSNFTKKLAIELENISDRRLLNSTSNYEIEIRLVENKEGLFNVLIKLYTIPDERFLYRKHAVAASIAPVQAALVAELSREYLKKDAQVLDPFCGVGTMLIERNKLVAANPMYGIDNFGEAIDKAIQNSRLDGTIINFINRDFFDFKHEYLFDEIFTNMPMRGGRKSEDEMKMLYDEFFRKALSHLKDDATIVMYTRDRDLVLMGVQRNKAYTIIKEYSISKKEGAYLYIIKVTQ